MSTISYEESVIVRIDKKISGHIKPVDGGYAYFPKGKKEHGEVFKSTGAVKISLEES